MFYLHLLPQRLASHHRHNAGSRREIGQVLVLDTHTPILQKSKLHQAFCVRQVSMLANTPPYHFRLIQSATLTKEMSTGTSTSGPITAAKAAPWWMPNVAIATAMASSKLLDDAVKDSVVASA